MIAIGVGWEQMTEQEAYNPGENWPAWTTPQQEIAVLRRALHLLARATLRGEIIPGRETPESEQNLVDEYVSQARLAP